jgi:hypothetical protein
MELLIGQTAARSVAAEMPTVVQHLGAQGCDRTEFVIRLARQSIRKDCCVLFVDACWDEQIRNALMGEALSASRWRRWRANERAGAVPDVAAVVAELGIMYFGADVEAAPEDLRDCLDAILHAVSERKAPKALSPVVVVINGLQAASRRMPGELKALLSVALSLNVTVILSDQGGPFIDNAVSEAATCRVFQRSLDPTVERLFARTVEPLLPFGSDDYALPDLGEREALVSVRHGRDWLAARVSMGHA